MANDLTTSLSNEWDAARFSGQFRSNQQMALTAFDSANASGKSRFYFVMPPGSGKTLLGLEIARRLGRPTICLCPNTAIQEQWVAQWNYFQPPSITAGDNPALNHPLTALTYQVICNIETPTQDGARADSDGEISLLDQQHAHRVRIDAIRNDDREQLLSLLHPNGRHIIDVLKSGTFPQSPNQSLGWTLILDECHHLLETWGRLLQAIIEEVGQTTHIVGLTATPPSRLQQQEADLYTTLFGAPDFHIPTPAVVKEGHLAPYQELVQIATPLTYEQTFINECGERFEELTAQLCNPSVGSISLPDWINKRLIAPKTASGTAVTFNSIEARDPLLVTAGMRYFLQTHTALPSDARLHEKYRQPMTIDDWIILMNDWYNGHLIRSTDPLDTKAVELIHGALPSLGYRLSATGIRGGTSLVDRVLTLSGSKAVAAIDILTAESAALGNELRALLLCDYELAGSDITKQLTGVLNPQAGSAILSLKTLLSNETVFMLNPVLVTGRTVACSRQTAKVLEAFFLKTGHLTIQQQPLVIPGMQDAETWQDVMILDGGPGWSSRIYVPIVTSAFEAGVTQCLIGTRSLLGEGWDAPAVNVLIDLTVATTPMSVTQMRGRSLRIDPRNPHKVADNWDVVCIDTHHNNGDADYRRLVRKHDGYFAPNALGELESGIAHIDPQLSPYGIPKSEQFAGINTYCLEQVQHRDTAYANWHVGEPYDNVEDSTLRVSIRPQLAPQVAQQLSSSTENGRAFRSERDALIRAIVFGGIIGAFLLISLTQVAALAVVGALLGLGCGYMYGRLIPTLTSKTFPRYSSKRQTSTRHPWQTLQPSEALEGIARAIAHTLYSEKLISVDMDQVSIRIESDGYYRCLVHTDNTQESEIFTNALDECLAPIQDPKYLLPRLIRQRHSSVRMYLERFFVPPAVVYHAVPSVLATIAKGESLARSWSDIVNYATLVHSNTPEGAAILEVQRGEDVFAEGTQMRQLWT